VPEAFEDYTRDELQRTRIYFPALFPLGWSGTESTITEANTGLLYQPRMMIDDECGAVGGMIGKGNQNRTEPAPVPLCPLQTPHDLTWALTLATDGKPATSP
jgi:hypothetical protein